MASEFYEPMEYSEGTGSGQMFSPGSISFEGIGDVPVDMISTAPGRVSSPGRYLGTISFDGVGEVPIEIIEVEVPAEQYEIDFGEAGTADDAFDEPETEPFYDTFYEPLPEDVPEIIIEEEPETPTKAEEAVETEEPAAENMDITPEIARPVSRVTEPSLVTVEDTATFRLLKNVGHFKAGAIFTVLVIICSILLGLVAVARYASIFDITRHTRILENENAKALSKLSSEKTNAGIREEESVESIAARLGMVRPAASSVIEVELAGGEVTRVFLSSEEAAVKSEDSGFYQSLMRFLGRIDYGD